MEAYGSVLWSKKSTTFPYSGPNNYSPQVLILFFKIHFNVTLPHICTSHPRGFLLPAFPTKNLHAFFLSPLRSTCPSHLYQPHLTTVILFLPYIPVIYIYILYKEEASLLTLLNRIATIRSFTFKVKKFYVLPDSAHRINRWDL